jgi:hypothetical protein
MTQLDHSRRLRLRFGLLAISCALASGCSRQGPPAFTTQVVAPALPTPTAKAHKVPNWQLLKWRLLYVLSTPK